MWTGFPPKATSREPIPVPPMIATSTCLLRRLGRERRQTIPVILREGLQAHIPTLSEFSTVREAVDKMDIYQFPALVIVNQDLKPIGVITEGDICREATRRDSVITMSNEPVIIFASKDPTSADVNQEISDALHRMLASGITILPVTDMGRLAGVVLRIDLLQALMMDASIKA